MITISKHEHGFLLRHWKASMGLLGLCVLVMGGMVALAYAEGVYADPAGQLNNPFKLACDTGVLADRRVLISEDGEYNWMFAKGQTLSVEASLETVQNNTIVVYLIDWSRPARSNTVLNGTLHNSIDKLEWNISLPHAGHWQLELVNYTGLSVNVKLYVSAGASGQLGLLNCMNPGDLFRFDSD